ncbi:unnamed protein product, partial [Nesidiocoris tenuis]
MAIVALCRLERVSNRWKVRPVRAFRSAEHALGYHKCIQGRTGRIANAWAYNRGTIQSAAALPATREGLQNNNAHPSYCLPRRAVRLIKIQRLASNGPGPEAGADDLGREILDYSYSDHSRGLGEPTRTSFRDDFLIDCSKCARILIRDQSCEDHAQFSHILEDLTTVLASRARNLWLQKQQTKQTVIKLVQTHQRRDFVGMPDFSHLITNITAPFHNIPTPSNCQKREKGEIARNPSNFAPPPPPPPGVDVIGVSETFLKPEMNAAGRKMGRGRSGKQLLKKQLDS